MNRRKFNKMALFTSGLLPFVVGCDGWYKNILVKLEANKPIIDYSDLSEEEALNISKEAHHVFMADPDFRMMGSEKIGMLMYPGFNPLDLVGPEYLFKGMMGASIYLVTPNLDLSPVSSGGGLSIVPTHTLKDCPDNLDVLFVPGAATGVINAMQNQDILNFLQFQAKTAKYITSVCTGSLLLGKAGLLRGKRATSHWLTLDMLAKLGAVPVKDRVVWDGNIVTGGGVTAGIDFGLEIVAKLRGKTYAEALQLDAEYNPAPPFNSGSPDTANPTVKKAFIDLYTPFLVGAAKVL